MCPKPPRRFVKYLWTASVASVWFDPCMKWLTSSYRVDYSNVDKCVYVMFYDCKLGVIIAPTQCNSTGLVKSTTPPLWLRLIAAYFFGYRTLRPQDTSTPKTCYETLRHKCQRWSTKSRDTLTHDNSDETQLHRWFVLNFGTNFVVPKCLVAEVSGSHFFSRQPLTTDMTPR